MPKCFVKVSANGCLSGQGGRSQDAKKASSKLAATLSIIGIRAARRTSVCTSIEHSTGSKAVTPLLVTPMRSSFSSKANDQANAFSTASLDLLNSELSLK